MYVVFFLTATLVGLYLYYNTQMYKTVNYRERKLGMGYMPKNSFQQYLATTEPNLLSSYLQTTNNYPHVNKCDPKQHNLELCSEVPSNRIETNIQYHKQPYVLYP